MAICICQHPVSTKPTQIRKSFETCETNPVDICRRNEEEHVGEGVYFVKSSDMLKQSVLSKLALVVLLYCALCRKKQFSLQCRDVDRNLIHDSMMSQSNSFTHLCVKVESRPVNRDRWHWSSVSCKYLMYVSSSLHNCGSEHSISVSIKLCLGPFFSFVQSVYLHEM